MNKMLELLLGLVVRVTTNARARFDRLFAQPEAGIDESTQKAIYIVGGVVLGLAVIAGITAFVTSYLAKLPS